MRGPLSLRGSLVAMLTRLVWKGIRRKGHPLLGAARKELMTHNEGAPTKLSAREPLAGIPPTVPAGDWEFPLQASPWEKQSHSGGGPSGKEVPSDSAGDGLVWKSY